MGWGKLNAFGFRTAGMIFLCLVSFWANAQHSDVRITSAASNSNGTWAYAQNGTYTFSPTADNAILSATDLQDKLAAYSSVEIKTARTGGTQSGNVTFEAAVTQLNCYYSVNPSTFRITSGGEIQFNANIRLRTNVLSQTFNVALTSGSHLRINAEVNFSGGDLFRNTLQDRSSSLTMVIAGDLYVASTGRILTKGWNNTTADFPNSLGGPGGTQTYTVSGAVSFDPGSIIDASGGDAVMPTYTNNGGTGGSITINVINSVLMRGTVQSKGGNGNRGGKGGAISITSSMGNIDYSGVLTSEGGIESGNVIGGDGGNITLNGATGLSIRNNVNAGLGRGTNYIGGGIVTLSTGNTTRTTGGGVNDGMVGSSIIRGSNFIKSGAGVLSLGAVNAYTGTTNLNGGKLYLAVAGAIPSGTALTSSTGTEIDVVGNSLTLASLDGGTKITNSVGGSVTLTVGSNNSSTSHSGVIEDGAGVMSLVKVGTGKLAITGANSYTGPTNITAGILSVGNSTGLGSVQSGTTVNSNSILEFFGGINVGAEALSLTGTGTSYQLGALSNLSGVNSFAGEISVTSGVRITGFNGTLNLTAANVITGTNANLLFGGYGILNITGIINIGTGGITYDGGGSLYLMTDNVYSGLTQVTGRNGTLRAGSNGALGSNSSGIVVADQAALELTGGISILGKSLTVSGLGVGGSGGSIRNVSGDNVWSGTITMAGTVGIGLGSVSGKLSLTGSPAIAASSYGLKVYGSPGGVVELVGEALYTGQTELIGGSLLLGNNERIPDVSSLKLSGGDLSTGGYTETLAELNLNTLSSITLGNSVHTLRFSGLSGLFDFHYLTINGWQGTYASPGSTGSAGRIYVGANAVLSPDRLGQMFFYNSGAAVQYNTLQLTDGELVPGSLKFTGATGHSDVRITSAATNSNGTWTLTQGGVYRFNPTADNAILSAADLQSKLGAYSFVEISTARSGGTQSGNMVFESPVTNLNCLTNGSNTSSLRITSGGVVQFYANMTIRSSQQFFPYNLILNAASIVRLNSVIDLSGSMASFASNTNPTGSVTMVVGGDLVVAGTGQVLTRGWENSQPSDAGFNGGFGGAQTYTVSGSVSLAAGSVLDASGGNSIRTFQTTAGTGGAISISAVNAVLMRGSVVSTGGYGGRGGTGGAISISSSARNIDYSGVLTSEGGYESGNVIGGNGGNITLSGATGLSIRNNVNAGLGRGTTFVGGGNVTLTTGNTTLTSGGGVNDGLVGGSIIRGFNFTKSGAGVLNLGGVSVYTGTTTLNGGKLYLSAAGAIPSGTALSSNSGTEIDLAGNSLTLASLAGSAKITSSVSGSITLTVGSNNSSTSHNGVIEDGAGVLRIVKTGTGKFTMTGANTYSGTTAVTAGILSVGHSTALGSVQGGTTVNTNSILEFFGGINVGAEALSLTGTGTSYQLGALYNLSGVNSFAGEISVTSGVRITGFNGTLNLTAANVITGTNSNLLFGGYGILNITGNINIGTGGITYDGGGSLYLMADNIYSGLTQVTGRNGVLRVGANAALGSNTSGVVVSDLAAMELIGGISVQGEPLTLTGFGVGSVGGVFRNVSGDNVWSGTITMAGTLGIGIGSAAGKLSLTGNPAIAASSYGLKVYGSSGGTVEFVGETLYTGQTELIGGTLLLGSNERIADASSLRLSGGDFSTGGYSETLGLLSLYAPSSISLGNTVHRLQFSGAGVYDYQLLTINGWQGSYASPGTSGTAGRIYVGASPVLTRDRLDQMFFFNASTSAPHYTLQLIDGEVVPGLNSLTGATGQSNVRISSVASNSNGIWTTSGSSTAVFTPTGDNAILSASDLQAKILAYSIVEIKTVRVGGRQAGSVVFDGNVTQVSGTTPGTFKITSAQDVQFNAILELRLAANSNSFTYAGYDMTVNSGGSVRVNGELRLSGGDATNTNPVRTSNVTMLMAGDLLVGPTGQILTKGWKYPNNSIGYNGGPGGTQNYTVSGGVNLAAGSILDASGGDTFQNVSSTTGGTGGLIAMNVTNSIVLRGSVISAGGKGNVGGTGGSLQLSSSAGFFEYSGVLSSQGGLGNVPSIGGNGGNINLSGFTGLSIRSDVNAGLGTGMTTYSNKRGGSVILSTANTVSTSGGGVNDGVVGGVLRGGDFTKQGAGVLTFGSVNAYLGSTALQEGRIQLTIAEAIPSTSDVTLSANTILDLNGFSNTVASIAGVSSTKITNSSSNACTFKFGTNNSTFDGLIEDGVGVVHLEKVGAGTTTLATTANTYTGLTRISGGNLAISHASSLGSTNAGTIADGGGLRLNGVTVSGEALTLGSLPTLGVLYANTGSNVWNGTLMLSAASSIYVNTSTNLSINPPTGPAIQGTNTNLTCNVYGTLNINGEIATGNATLTKNYTGILNLNTANSYTGLTTLASGQTLVKNDLALGSNSAGTVISSGANLTLDGALNVSGETLTITSNAITANGALLTKNGASTWSGNISLAGTAVNWNTESDLTVTGTIANGSTLWTVGRTTGSTGNLIVNGIISGTGGLDKTGTGQMTLNAVNTYTGLTRITAGRLVLGGNQVISNASNVYFNGGTLNTEGYSETLGQLFISDNSTLQLGAGTHTINFASAGTFTTGKTLTVNGWDGVYSIVGSGSSPSLDNSGMLKTTSTKFISSNGVLRSAGAINQYGQIRVSGQSGTSGNFFVGSPLSASALNQIKFFNATANTTHFSVQLGTNEVVPDFTR